MTSERGGVPGVLQDPSYADSRVDLGQVDLVEALARRLSVRGVAVAGNDDCGLDADCPPDQICLDGRCL